MKIGVFGGTFNPPHSGHVRLAKAAADSLGLSRVLIIPACIPPHKIPGKLVSGEARLEMCRLAFGGDERFEVSSIEIDRGSKSYTVETLRELKKLFPQDELYFIIGSDMLETLTGWYRWEEILELAHICAASREKGYSASFSQFTQSQRERIIFLDIDPLEVSSTSLRAEITGKNAAKQIDAEVLSYIKANHLYDDGLSMFRNAIGERLDSKRIHHSECVSECAAALAEKYGADIEKARLAGLVHDITKNASAKEHKELIEAGGNRMTELEEANSNVWHQMSAEVFLRQTGLVSDEEILGAVRWHTTGKAGMSLLEKTVYVADFISEDRSYGDVGVVRRLAELSLEHAMLYTTRYTIEKLVSRDLLVHPATVECYNDMLLHFRVQKG